MIAALDGMIWGEPTKCATWARASAWNVRARDVAGDPELAQPCLQFVRCTVGEREREQL